MERKFTKNIFSYKELILNLTMKDFKVRYKSAGLGILWSLLNPLLMMVILSVVFSLFIKIQIEKYPIFLLIALLPWYFFSQSLLISAGSIVDNANLIKKVNFPRQIIPLSIVLSNLINFLVSLIILFIFMLAFKVKLSLLIFFLPAVIFLQLVFVLGVSLAISALHTVYRDIKYIVEALLLCGFYLTPIFYPITLIPQKFQKLYMLNPMAGIITIYRDLLFYGNPPNLKIAIYVASVSLIIFAIGWAVFIRKDKIFADFV